MIEQYNYKLVLEETKTGFEKYIVNMQTEDLKVKRKTFRWIEKLWKIQSSQDSGENVTLMSNNYIRDLMIWYHYLTVLTLPKL